MDPPTLNFLCSQSIAYSLHLFQDYQLSILSEPLKALLLDHLLTLHPFPSPHCTSPCPWPSFFSSFTSISITKYTSDAFLSFAKEHCKNVSSLIFQNGVSYEQVVYAVQSFRHCESLTLNSSKVVSDKLIKEMTLSGIINQVLHLALDYTKVSNTALYSISSNCPHLSSLSLRGCNIDDGGISSIASSCGRLTSLNLSKCYKVTDESLKHVSRNLPLLQSLVVYGCSISDRGLICVGDGCPNLQQLDIGRCTGISDHGMKVAIPKLTKMTAMYMSGCYKITDISLQCISLSCKYLHTLEIDGCKAISDEGIRWIASQCAYMMHLNLRDITFISDCSIEYLACNCPYIETLNIKQCNKLTVKTIALLIKQFSNLKEINLLGYQKFAAEDVAYLKLTRPGVTVIYYPTN